MPSEVRYLLSRIRHSIFGRESDTALGHGLQRWRRRSLIICLSLLGMAPLAAADEVRFVELVNSVLEAPALELQSIAPSADGEYLYGAGVQYHSGIAASGLALWDLDESGIPSFRRAWSTSGLGFAAHHLETVALSPDDRHLYVLGRASDGTGATELLVFESSDEGHLDSIQRLVAADPSHPEGVVGLTGASHMALSPDGRHLYAGGSNGLAVFARNLVDGRLAPVQSLTVAVSGLLVAADGSAVWASGSGLTTFLRDTSSGMLTEHDFSVVQVGDIRVE